MAETQTIQTAVSKDQPSWLATITVIVVGLVILLAIFWETVASAVHQWNTSTAYNYGYLIAPITIYLLWNQRDAIAVWRPAPTALGFILIFAFAIAWLAGDLMGIDEGRQIGLVGMMQGLFLTILGWPLFRRLAFPLQYLWLQVPTGEFLLDPMQKMAHAVAVVMLKLSGMTVYAEGILIQVPSGNFVVEPGCSGLNFLLASIALALLYGKLTYQKWSARLVCLGVAIVAAIIANFFRVYLIVAITEWSSRKIDVASDHLFYGWLFFGVVMMVMMWWGMRFRDLEDDRPDPANERPASTSPHSIAREISYAALALVMIALPVILSQASASIVPGEIAVRLPQTVGGWTRSPARPDWTASTAGGDATATSRYENGDRTIDITVAYYSAQFDGHEAASALNSPAGSMNWEIGARGSRRIKIGASNVSVTTTELRSPNEPRLAISWYQSSGCTTASRLIAKACAARSRLTGGNSTGAYLAISAPIRNDAPQAMAVIEEFAGSLQVSEMLPGSAPAVTP